MQAPTRSGKAASPSTPTLPQVLMPILVRSCVQEPTGPQAEEAMAGLQVEVRCYKHVKEYTLCELNEALEQLEQKRAAGQRLGSWTDDQLEALRAEVRV